MHSSLFFLLLLATCVLPFTLAYRILAICPTPARSHQIVFHSITSSLLERGHELLIMTTDPLSTSNPNVTQIDWSSSYKSRFATANWIKLRGHRVIALGLDDIPRILDNSLSHPDVQNLIKSYMNETFDAVLVEYVGCTPIYAFAELFNTTMIGFTSLQIDANQHNLLGNGVHPILHSPNLMGYYSGTNVIRRVWNVISYFAGRYLYEMFNYKFDRIIEKHFGDKVQSRSVELARRVDMLFLDANPFLGNSRPLVQNVIPVGFLHVNPPKPLPTKLQRFLDNSYKGAIYFSFGTIVNPKHMDKNIMENFKRAFAGLKYNVLWKREIEQTENSTSKTYVSTWFPQQDVLG